jgi:hypothetical protein
MQTVRNINTEPNIKCAFGERSFQSFRFGFVSSSDSKVKANESTHYKLESNEKYLVIESKPFIKTILKHLF